MITTLKTKMPEGRKCAVTLSFDFDAISVWLGTEKQNSPTPVSRGEFGAVGARRILSLLRKYDLKSTWFIPGHTIETFPDECGEVIERGHEIGHHNYLHEIPNRMTSDGEKKVIKRGIECIKKITGKKPLGYRSPSWDLSPNTLKLLLEEGFLYESSMMAHDFLPYKARTGDVAQEDGPFIFGKDSDLIELPVSWILDDFPNFEYLFNHPGSGLKSGSAVLENWIGEFEYMYQNVPSGVLNIAFHPQIIGRGHRMMVLEKFITHILEKRDVWIATMEEVAMATRKPPN